MIADPAVVVVDAGGPGARALACALAVELPRVGFAGVELLEHAPPEGAIVVLGLAAPVPLALCGRAVAWADQRAPRPGLIACVPGGDTADAEIALAAGLDDAVIGAACARELVARVRAVDRRVRRAASIPERLRCGALVLAPGAQGVWVDGVPHALSRMEFSVLRALIAAGGAAMTRAALLDAAWCSRRAGVGERAVDNVIVTLRKKLGAPDRIRTVRGVGFRLLR